MKKQYLISLAVLFITFNLFCLNDMGKGGSYDGYSMTETGVIELGGSGSIPAPTDLTVSDITSSAATFGWTENGAATQWNIEVGLPGFTPGTSSYEQAYLLVTENPYTGGDLTPATDYEVYVQSYYNGNVSIWSLPAAFTTTVNEYCEASGANQFVHITSVAIGDINNPSGASPYSDYTALSTSVTQGDTGVEITTSCNYNFYYTDLGLWIDWNQDYDFEDAGEDLFCVSYGNGTYTFDVPADATLGDTRMRIRLKYSDDGCYGPCGTTAYGEVEDYTINITSGTLDAPTNVSISHDGTNITLTWDPVAGAASYNIYSSTNPYAARPWTEVTDTGSFPNPEEWTATSPDVDTFYYVTSDSESRMLSNPSDKE